MSDDKAEEMRLSRFEFRAMNTPFRRFILKHFEFRTFVHFLRKNGIDLKGKVLVDAGCGSGYDTGLIAKEFEPSRLVAFDIMPEQIWLARRLGINAEFYVGDMTHLDLPDGMADAVFVFAVLHHIPDRHKAVKEIWRILADDGVLLVCEPHEKFHWPELEEGIQNAGFEMVERRRLYAGFFRNYLWRKCVVT